MLQINYIHFLPSGEKEYYLQNKALKGRYSGKFIRVAHMHSIFTNPARLKLVEELIKRAEANYSEANNQKHFHLIKDSKKQYWRRKGKNHEEIYQALEKEGCLNYTPRPLTIEKSEKQKSSKQQMKLQEERLWQEILEKEKEKAFDFVRQNFRGFERKFELYRWLMKEMEKELKEMETEFKKGLIKQELKH